MNPSIKDDGIYFGRQHIEKINADPWFLIFVKEGSLKKGLLELTQEF
jgi:hypothetical protein